MQEHMATAMKLAVQAADKPGGAGVPGAAAESGRRTLAALVAAREENCPCRAASLLREEFDVLLGSFLKSAVKATGDSEAPPATVEPAPASAEAPGG